MESAHQFVGHSHRTLMNRTRKLHTFVLLAALAAGLFSLACPPARGAEDTGYSTNAADQVVCKRQLNIIYGALQQYREQHGGNLPGKLSDLTPDYIYNSDFLVCPYVRHRGGMRIWTKLNDLADDAYTSYYYEMPLEPMPRSHWRGLPRKTWRDFKERQAEEVGPVVPVVRCLDHRPCLNLAISAQIYESAQYWETNFSRDDHLLTVANLFRVPSERPLTSNDFPRRDPSADPRLLDLTPCYNASLSNGWQGFAGNHLASLPIGIHKFDGIEFDVRGVIQLRGSDLLAVFPDRVEGIAVKQKCNRIHFLHAVSWTYGNDVLGSYVVHYTNGVVQTFPLLKGQHIADWWRKPGDASKLAKATVAWTGQNEAAKAYGMELRLYHTVWENPLKEVEISAITFDELKPTGPFVVAITLE